MTIKVKKNTSAIILAAGKSERMGYPKFMLRCADGQTFLQKLVSEFLLFGCRQVVVVLNEHEYQKVLLQIPEFPSEVLLVENSHPEWGRFYSLKLAVDRIKPIDYIYVGNIDNPFVDAELLGLLYHSAAQADYLMPEYKGRGGHPILISQKIAEDIKTRTTYDYHLKEFLSSYSSLRVEVNNPLVLANINTIDDYRQYFGDWKLSKYQAPIQNSYDGFDVKKLTE